MITKYGTYYQYSDGTYHAAGVATINKETFEYPIRIPGKKPIFKITVKPKKNEPDTKVIQ